MKIVIAHYKYYIQGGPERYMLKFMELARNHGCEIIPFSIDYEENMETEYSKYFVSTASKTGMFDQSNRNLKYLFENFRREFHNKEAYFKLKKLIKEQQPDLLYVLIPGELTADIFKAAKEENVPIMLRLSDFRLLCGSYSLRRGTDVCNECICGNYFRMVKHRCVKGSVVLSALRAVSLYYARRRNAYRYVDAIIAPPKFTIQKFADANYFSRNMMYDNPTFVDCSEILPTYNHENYVLCLGRFSPEKGFIYVVEAMKYLKDIPVTIAVTGEADSCDEKLKGIIEQYELSEKIKFIGFVHGKELEEIISEAMCVAAPAIWYENMPNTVIEAYAYGKPVIASKLGSLEEMVEEGKTGYLFEPKNVEQIAECIRKLYEDSEKYKELSKNARMKCEKDFNPEKHWKKFIEIYESIK